MDHCKFKFARSGTGRIWSLPRGSSGVPKSSDAPGDGVTFRAADLPVGRTLAPGEEIQIGWLRLTAGHGGPNRCCPNPAKLISSPPPAPR